MKTFLLWREDPGVMPYREPDAVADKLVRVFSRFYKNPLEVHHRSSNGTHLLHFGLPLNGWLPAFREADADRWALAVEYPVDGMAHVPSAGMKGEDRNLLALAGGFERDPEGLFSEITPPYALVWENFAEGSFFAVTDGLGVAKLYEYWDGRHWALTNRISAFLALGLELAPDLTNWAARWALNFFPLDLTGFRNVRSLTPGTRVAVSRDGVKKESYHSQLHWITPSSLSRSEILENARSSMQLYLRCAARQMDGISFGLSGGWDSRPVAASLRAMDVPFAAYTRGEDWRPDVLLAKRLCEIAGMPLERREKTSTPSHRAQDIENAICSALIWQSGFRSRRHHHTFAPERKRKEPGRAVLTGRCGEICRYRKLDFPFIEAWPKDNPSGHVADVIVSANRLPRFLRQDVVEKVREIVSSPFTVARSWGLADKEALQFLISQRYTSNFERYFCYESNFTITPYFSRGIVNAGFSLPISDLKSNPVHRYIVEADAPDWVGVEYESEMTARLKAESRSGLAPGLDPGLVAEAPAWLRPTGNEPYNRSVFWQELGAPAIEAEIEKGGAWEEIYDPDLVRATWQKSPEEFLIVAILPKALERVTAIASEDVT